MTGNQFRTPARRATALLLLVTMTGCTTMRPVATPRQYIPANQPRVVWVSRANQSPTMAIEGPRLLGDTLVGFHEGDYIELPMAEISSVQARQYSRGKTIAFLVAMGVGAAALTFVIAGGAGTAVESTDENDIGIRQRRW